MSGASTSNDSSTTKAVTDDSNKTPSAAAEGQNKKGPILEEDDEFEDFPVDGRPHILPLQRTVRRRDRGFAALNTWRATVPAVRFIEQYTSAQTGSLTEAELSDIVG